MGLLDRLGAALKRSPAVQEAVASAGPAVPLVKTKASPRAVARVAGPRSPVQNQVLGQYADILRAVRSKPLSPEERKEMEQQVRTEFRRFQHMPITEVMEIEKMLYYGNEQLTMLRRDSFRKSTVLKLKTRSLSNGFSGKLLSPSEPSRGVKGLPR